MSLPPPMGRLSPGVPAAQITVAMEQAIREGAFAPGSALPSIRQLASALDVSPATVAASLRALRTRGLIVSRERRRSIVSFRPPLGPALPRDPVPSGVRDLASGNPDPELLPALERALGDAHVKDHLYGEPAILPGLERWARAQFERDGIKADHLCLAGGALDGVERALAADLAPGDGVVVEDPGYDAVFDLLRALGLVPHPVAIDDRGLRPAELGRALRDQNAKALVLTPRGQNPTGAALDADRARDLRALVEKRPDLLLIEDDHQGATAGVPAHSVVGRRERWVAIRSLAKSLGPDLRLAILAGDATTIARVEGRLALGPGWVSRVLQYLALALVGSREVRALLRSAERTYRTRRQTLLDALRQRGIRAQGRSGFNVWVPVVEEARTVRALLAAGWLVAAGERYRLESPPAIRVTTATLKADEARRFAADLARVTAPTRRVRAA